MKTTGLFTTHRYEIELKSIMEPVKIVFFGDVHRDSLLHAREEWQDFLAYAKRQKNAYFFGMGDYIDSASSSERECLGRAALHESTRNDLVQIAQAKVSLLAKELGFMQGRLIGLIGGNHYFAFEDGTNTDNRLCGKLGCKFLGVSGFVRLTVKYGTRRYTFDICAHHGAGGARLVGGSLNRVDQMRDHFEADCYVMGHDHKKGVLPCTPRMSLEQDPDGPNGLRLKERQAWIVRSGSFLKSYEDGQISYNVDSARGPCSLGHVELELTASNKNNQGLKVRGIS